MVFLRNGWYCGGWSNDLTDKPVGRTMLDEYIVLYRDGSGQPIAMTGRCPHRFAPLDRGEVKGDTITCPYHGLVFASDGRCIENPHGDGHIPDRARLATYPVVERNGTVWLWMGDHASADESQLPSPAWLDDAEFATVRGYLKVNANYQLIVDNLLDLTHAPYLHTETVGTTREAAAGLRHDFSRQGNIVRSSYEHDAMIPLPIYSTLFTGVGKFRADMSWYPPANLPLHTSMSPIDQDASQRAVSIPSVHYLVPETATTTHYFFAMGRDAAIADANETERMGGIAMRAFLHEDEPMIHACQELMGTDDLFALQPAILRTDVAGVQARRILGQLLAREQKGDADFDRSLRMDAGAAA
jgi:vanillate O-demethylase monooxygenase subunit